MQSVLTQINISENVLSNNFFINPFSWPLLYHFSFDRNYLIRLEFISTIGKLQWFMQKIYLSLPPEVVSGVNLSLYVFFSNFFNFIFKYPSWQYLLNSIHWVFTLLEQYAKVASESRLVDKFESNGLNGFSIFWGGLARIDALKVSVFWSGEFVLRISCHFSWLHMLRLLVLLGSPRNMFNILWSQGPADSCSTYR